MSGILLFILGLGLVSFVAAILGIAMGGVGKGRRHGASTSSSGSSGWWASTQGGHDHGGFGGDGGGFGGDGGGGGDCG